MGMELPAMIRIADLAAALAAISAFAAVLALAMPQAGGQRVRARFQAIARERDRLRARWLADLGKRDVKSRLRRKETGLAARLAALWPQRKAGEAETETELAATLRMAGLRGPGAEALYRVCRAVLPVLFFLAVLLAGQLQGAPAMTSLTLAVAAACFGYGLPRAVIGRLVARRQRAILRALPDGLDLLLICVNAGMSVEAAIGRVTSELAGQSVELAEELSLTMAELAYLPARWRAYHNLGERTGLAPVKLIAAALAQAERYGTSIGQALGAAAQECREARLFEAERKAAALPPKLTIPLVVFFLPIVMIVILAPALMQARKSLKENRPAFIERQAQRAAKDRQAPPSSPSRPQPPRPAP
jgi:tight adherence protein C